MAPLPARNYFLFWGANALSYGEEYALIRTTGLAKWQQRVLFSNERDNSLFLSRTLNGGECCSLPHRGSKKYKPEVPS